MSLQYHTPASLAAAITEALPALAAIAVTPVALTTRLTSLTHHAPTTPDYAIAQLTATTPYGFASSDEGETLLKVVANMQTRINELEVQLQAAGLLL